MTDNGEESQEVHEAGEYELVATRDIPAPPALVYKAWSNPEHLSQWWGAERVYEHFPQVRVSSARDLGVRENLERLEAQLRKMSV